MGWKTPDLLAATPTFRPTPPAQPPLTSQLREKSEFLLVTIHPRPGIMRAVGGARVMKRSIWLSELVSRRVLVGGRQFPRPSPKRVAFALCPWFGGAP